MRPPNDNEVDTREPASVARWAEAWARWWLHGNPRSENRTLRAAQSTAYADVARLMVGLTGGAMLKEIRREIYVLGHSRGIVPWEDPEAAERKTPGMIGLDPYPDLAKPAVPAASDGAEAERLTTDKGDLRR